MGEGTASEVDIDRRRLANDDECRALKQQLLESHARELSQRKEHEEQTYNVAIKVQQAIAEQAAHEAQQAKTDSEKQATQAQVDMLKAAQLVSNAEQALERAT